MVSVYSLALRRKEFTKPFDNNKSVASRFPRTFVSCDEREYLSAPRACSPTRA